MWRRPPGGHTTETGIFHFQALGATAGAETALVAGIRVGVAAIDRPRQTDIWRNAGTDGFGPGIFPVRSRPRGHAFGVSWFLSATLARDIVAVVFRAVTAFGGGLV